MKKINIITINDYSNFGNRLQNYGLNFILNKKTKSKTIYLLSLKDRLKNIIKILLVLNVEFRRYRKFYFFSKKYIRIVNKYNDKNVDYFVAGSDQIWNPEFALKDEMLLMNIEPCKRISYAASFGVNKLPKDKENIVKEELSKFKAISVREDAGKKIVEELTGRADVEVLIDPTMLLTSDEWDKVSKKPKQLKNDKYILNYFLGDLSIQRRKEIERIAKENNCKIINLLDKNDPMYVCGPSEFLYLEKHAFLICTDSFHSSVFAILYNRPFVVFDREQNGVENMSSRLDTLISKLKLKNRRYNGKNITEENLNHDYSEAYKILENEREKSNAFLKKALDIK